MKLTPKWISNLSLLFPVPLLAPVELSAWASLHLTTRRPGFFAALVVHLATLPPGVSNGLITEVTHICDFAPLCRLLVGKSYFSLCIFACFAFLATFVLLSLCCCRFCLVFFLFQPPFKLCRFSYIVPAWESLDSFDPLFVKQHSIS